MAKLLKEGSVTDVRDWAESRTILRGTVGSRVHGLALEGNDDRDEMGVAVEPREFVMGFRKFEQYIYRTAAEREHRADAPSQPGDLDLTIYSLRKWARLTLFKANPTCMLLLFVPPSAQQVTTVHGEWLQKLAPAFASQQAVRSYLGYLTHQRQRLEGTRGQKDVHRRMLEQKHGYDTKYAMHALRLGIQGVEYCTSATITLPMRPVDKALLMAVRRGEVKFPEVLDLVHAYEEKLRVLRDTSTLPAKPNVRQVEQFVMQVYTYVWGRYEGWTADNYDPAVGLTARG